VFRFLITNTFEAPNGKWHMMGLHVQGLHTLFYEEWRVGTYHKRSFMAGLPGTTTPTTVTSRAIAGAPAW
jgi:hypothetical protein